VKRSVNSHGQRRAGHTRSIPRYSCAIWAFPDDGIKAVISEMKPSRTPTSKLPSSTPATSTTHTGGNRMKRIRSLLLAAAVIAAIAASSVVAQPAESPQQFPGYTCYKVSPYPWPQGTWRCYWHW